MTGPGQHPTWGPGDEVPRNLRNLAFSRYLIEAKTTLMTGDNHNPQKLNFDFTFHGKIIIKFTSHRKAVNHDSRELNFLFHTSRKNN